MKRVIISGLLLIANLFLLGIYARFSSDLMSWHLLSDFEYRQDVFVFQLYLYINSLIYITCILLKPDFTIIDKISLWHFYAIFEIIKVIDFVLFYHWNLIDVNYVGGFLIGITFLYMVYYAKFKS